MLTLNDIVLRLGGRPVLDGASLSLSAGQKIGLVGRNGAGKSTLLRVVAGDIGADGGTVQLAARARLGRVAQQAPSGEATLTDIVLAADAERLALLAEAESCADGLRLAEIHERLAAIGAAGAPARAAAILDGLGFDATAQARSVSAFSGGWRMRVALAAALFAEPDLLLLDEPTNHLDLEASLWLEGWLKGFRGGLLLVSHDRDLLNRAVTHIAHLDKGAITLYPGGYDNFVRVRAERAAQQQKAAERQVAERARLMAFVDRFRAKATKARQAQSRLKAIERMPPIDPVAADASTRFDLPPPAELAPPIITTDRAAAGYDGRTVLRGLDLRIDLEDRIALLGPNGNGKSTLARLLAGTLPPLAGEVRRSPRLTVGYFAQDQHEQLDLAATPLLHMSRALPKATETQCRSHLARFGLDADRAETRVGDLSGGEKARLVFALITREAPQLLILDEPTNHLDIDAREALVRALADWPGAVVLVSHDPALVELIADRLWLVEGGTVQPFEGDMEDYRSRIAAARREDGPRRTEPRERAEEGRASRQEERRNRAELRAATAPLRRRLKAVEDRMTRLAAEAATVEKSLADPALYANGGRAAEVTRLTARRAQLARETEAAEEEWLALSAEIEAAEQAA
ncbi:MAG: ABC-F family ATP-binding cassette domain-containing protein [Alphaproteobacteria bacterium]|nr:ABC-F family ATP-binding cassette domain-containing protein [Alphaproteobacteria bacterium]